MAQLISLLIVFAIILLSMMLHELAHGLVAYWLGDNTAKAEGRLTLNPLKHLDPILSVLMPLMLFLSGGPIFGGAKPVPINTRNLKYGAWGMALVAIAGPITNFLIAFVAFLIGYFSGGLFAAGLMGTIWGYLVSVNLGFGVFNLIPIPPLDGSRVLYAIAPDGVQEVMTKMEQLGVFLIMIIVVAFPSIISTIMGGGVDAILKAFFWIVGVR